MPRNMNGCSNLLLNTDNENIWLETAHLDFGIDEVLASEKEHGWVIHSAILYVCMPLSPLYKPEIRASFGLAIKTKYMDEYSSEGTKLDYLDNVLLDINHMEFNWGGTNLRIGGKCVVPTNTRLVTEAVITKLYELLGRDQI